MSFQTRREYVPVGFGKTPVLQGLKRHNPSSCPPDALDGNTHPWHTVDLLLGTCAQPTYKFSGY